MSPPLHLVDATMFWSPSGGGVRRYLLTKHAWLAGRADWRHTLAVPQLDGEAADAATLPSWPLPFSKGYRLPLNRRAMANVLASLQPSLIEAGDPYRVAWAVRDAARQCGIPAVAYCHSNLEAMARLAGGKLLGGQAARWARHYLRHLYAGFDLVLAPGRGMCEHLAEAGIGRVACQPLGVDTQTFRPSADREPWRAAHGIAPGERLLVYAGRFAAEKHLDVLAGAILLLGAPYRLLCIGAGPKPPPASERVQTLAFVSSTSELAAALGAADAFVHAGDQETFGLSALEAMACATPAVVRGSEGLGEMVDPSCGIAVGAGTPAAFAEAIGQLFDGDMAQLRAGARRRAERSDWNQVLPSLLAHYGRLLGHGESAPARAIAKAAATPELASP